MELEKTVAEHGKILGRHDKEISRINDNLLEMQKGMNEGLARVDESNKFLREQNMRQSEQNIEILNAVLNRNEKSDERNYELKMIDKTNMWKMILGIGASAGAVFAFVLELIKFFGGR